MGYQIDQSGKIERTNKTTVVALANDNLKSIKITAVEKQRLLAALKEIEYPKTNYVYRVFATLIFILTRNEKLETLEIDKEYPGHESVIKDMFIHLYSHYNLKMPEIAFTLVGKKSSAHKIALPTFQAKLKPTVIVRAEEVLKMFYPNKKGRRSRSSRDNP